jgi:hypothetical protein
MVRMRYKRAVEKLRLLAEGCERMKDWPPDFDPWLVAMYTFGPVLDGTDPLDDVHVVGVIRVPPEEARWGSEPHGSEWAADILRLSKGGYEYWWRSYQDPVWNHYIKDPVRIWSQDGIDEEALAALEERRFSDLNRLTSDPVDQRRQVHDELGAALARMREVHGSYWDRDWRRDHRGLGRYPENELWEAVEGYLDLLDASREK